MLDDLLDPPQQVNGRFDQALGVLGEQLRADGDGPGDQSSSGSAGSGPA